MMPRARVSRHRPPLWLLVLVALAAGGPSGVTAASLSVFAGVEPVRWLAKAVGGERVTTRVLVPPGQSPHTFEPTPRQLAALEAADIYFSAGMPFEEAWVPRLRETVPGLRVIALAAGHDHGQADPHAWTDPLAAIDMAAAIRDALGEVDAAGSAGYGERFSALSDALEAAHEEMRRVLAPFRGKAMVVYHPAWGALAGRYGLEQLAVEDEGKSPGARHLAGVIERARANGSCAVFVQPQFSTRAAEQVASALGVSLVALDPMQGNLPDHLVDVARKLARYMERECPR